MTRQEIMEAAARYLLEEIERGEPMGSPKAVKAGQYGRKRHGMTNNIQMNQHWIITIKKERSK
jgi:hypothetical protein